MVALLVSLSACVISLLAYQVINQDHQDKFQALWEDRSQELLNDIRRANGLTDSVIRVLPIVYRDPGSTNETNLREWALILNEALKGKPDALPLRLCLAKIRIKEGNALAAFQTLDAIPENMRSDPDVEQLRKECTAAAELEQLSRRFFEEANFSFV